MLADISDKTVVGVFFVEDQIERVARTGKIYFDIVLRDKSGIRTAKYWSALKNDYKHAFINAKVRPEPYNGSVSLIVDALRAAEDAEIVLADFCASLSEEEIDANEVRLKQVISGFEADEALKEVVQGVLTEEILNKLVLLPIGDEGGRLSVLGSLGGLVLKALGLAETALDGFSEGVRNFGLASVLLAKVGVIDALEMSGPIVRKTENGILNSVALLSAKRLFGVAGDVGSRLTHNILVMESGSPSTPEGVVIRDIFRLLENKERALSAIERSSEAVGEFLPVFDGKVCFANFYRKFL